MVLRLTLIILICCGNIDLTFAQSLPTESTALVVPTIIKFGGSIRDSQGTYVTGSQAITIALYAEQEGGSALWTETHTVTLDPQGRYMVYLGSASGVEGIPAHLFSSGETQWVGVTPSDGIERRRLPITTVPYAFKAGDAGTLGGKRPEEFVSVSQLATLLNSNVGIAGTGGGIPDVTSQSNNLRRAVSLSDFAKLNSPNVFQEVQSFPGGAKLTAVTPEVSQNAFHDSAPLDFQSSIIQPLSGTYLLQTFRWISEPAAESSPTPSARLTLLFGANSEPAPTGLSINSDGTINFAPGQNLPTDAVMQAISGNPNGSFPGSGQSPVVNTQVYNWSETPNNAGPGINMGNNIITLTPCPAGVNGKDAWHYLYISNTANPEVVLITGGSCVSRQKTGTIEFSAKYFHKPGYSIATATDGVQEAIIDAIVPSTEGKVTRNVLIDPGAHVFRARLSVRASSLALSASGSTINCVMTDTCIMVGDPANASVFNNVQLNGLQMVPGVSGGKYIAVEDNANQTTIANLSTAKSPVANGSFGSLIQVDNDQAATIVGLATYLSPWSRCDLSFCSTAVIGPGKGNSGVLWIKNSTLSLGCAANGIDNQDANTLHLSDVVLEAYPQFGIRSRTTYGNVPAALMTNVYEEVGNCVNLRGTGTAGAIMENGNATGTGVTGPVGKLPLFDNSGPMQLNYAIVVHSSTMGTSPVYAAGYALSNGASPFKVLWEQIGNSGIVTYDLLQTTGGSASAPFGTGAFAVATGIPASECANQICSFVVDPLLTPSQYTVVTDTPYWVSLKMWPGNLILTTASDYENTGGGTPTFYFTDLLTIGGIVNSAGAIAPSVFAQVCGSQSAKSSSVWIQCLGGDAVSNDNPAITATILQLFGNGGGEEGLKGRLILEGDPSRALAATHAFTVLDSNPAKTMAVPTNRPTWDATDTYIGFDQPTAVTAPYAQLSLGSPVSISNYIGNDGDNVSWGERLTKTAKVFQVPVQATSGMTVQGNLFLNGSCLGTGCGPISATGPQVNYSFVGTSGTLGENWTVTAGRWSIANGQATFINDATGTGGYSAMAVFTGRSFGNDQFATAQISYGTGGTTAAGVGVRMSPSAATGYVCFANSGITLILKYIAGTPSDLGTPGAGFPSGDYLTAQVSGNTISCLDNGVPIAGLTVTDSSSPLTTGSPGMFGAYSVSSFIANFSAGSLSYTANGLITFGAGLRTLPTRFESLPPCSSSTEGTQQAITDSTTNTWGTVITGGESYHVLAYCDGSNWTVH